MSQKVTFFEFVLILDIFCFYPMAKMKNRPIIDSNQSCYKNRKVERARTSGFAACGKLFSSLFGMDYLQAMILSATVIIIYCTLGGFHAASTTGYIQSIIMTIALFAVVGL